MASMRSSALPLTLHLHLLLPPGTAQVQPLLWCQEPQWLPACLIPPVNPRRWPLGRAVLPPRFSSAGLAACPRCPHCEWEVVGRGKEGWCHELFETAYSWGANALQNIVVCSSASLKATQWDAQRRGRPCTKQGESAAQAKRHRCRPSRAARRWWVCFSRNGQTWLIIVMVSIRWKRKGLVLFHVFLILPLIVTDRNTTQVWN